MSGQHHADLRPQRNSSQRTDGASEADEKHTRERHQREQNEHLFAGIIAHQFDQNTVLLRCEALHDYIKQHPGYDGNIASSIATFCRNKTTRAWTLLVQNVGGALDEQSWARRSQADFEAYWMQWKTGVSYRRAIQQAQHRALDQGNPDG